MCAAPLRLIIGSIVLATAFAGRRRRYIQIPLFGVEGEFLAFLGDPSQIDTVIGLSTYTSELVIIGEGCGQRADGCPRFCNDANFAKILCDVRCRPMNPRGISLICGDNTGRYDPELSNKSSVLDGNWRARLPLSRDLAGEIRHDELTIYGFGDEGIRTVNFTFVMALMFDSRYLLDELLLDNDKKFADMQFAFRSQTLPPPEPTNSRSRRSPTSTAIRNKRKTSGIFGLRPGPNSAMQQLFQTLPVDAAIMSLAIERIVDSVKHTIERAGQFLTVGAVDMARCNNWRWFEAATDEHFVMRFPYVDFMGVEFRDVYVELDFSEIFLIIPTPTADRLSQAGVLHYYKSIQKDAVKSFTYDCRRNPFLQFQNEEREPLFLLDKHSLVIPFKGQKEKCVSLIFVDRSHVYTWPRDREIWRLGKLFFLEHCLGYDYERRMIGIGSWRDTAAHPFL